MQFPPIKIILLAASTLVLALPIIKTDATLSKRIYELEIARNAAAYPEPESRTSLTKRIYEPEIARNAAAYPAPESHAQ